MEDTNEQSRAPSGTGLGDDPLGPKEDEEITIKGDSSPRSGNSADGNKSSASEESQEIPDFEEVEDEVPDYDSNSRRSPSRVSSRTRSRATGDRLTRSISPRPTGRAIAQKKTEHEHVNRIKALQADILSLKQKTVESNAMIESLNKTALEAEEKVTSKDQVLNRMRDELRHTTQSQADYETEIRDSQDRFNVCSAALMHREDELAHRSNSNERMKNL